jgi:hypothetical protein
VNAQSGQIVPLLDCVIYRFDTNTLLAFFGYASTFTTDVTIEVGLQNFFSPGAIFRNQPTVFHPGYHFNEFATSFVVSGSLTQITWFLDGNSIAARNDTSLYCTPDSNCTCPAGPAGPPGPPGPSGKDGVNGTFNPGSCRTVVATNSPSRVQEFQDEDLPEQPVTNAMCCSSNKRVGCGIDAIASCDKGEYLLTGGGECSFPLVMRATGVWNGNNWKTSCIGIPVKKTWAKATAVCCTP